MFGDRVRALTYAPRRIGLPVTKKTIVVNTPSTMKKYVPDADAIASLRYESVRSS